LVYTTNPNLYPRSNTDDPLLKYLKNEGDRFGEYGKQLFPHGVEIQGDNENLSKQTHDNLFKNTENRVTLFEGVIQHESFYARPDILDKIVTTESDNDDGLTIKTELRVIEVKSKSWNSKYTIEEKMMTKKGGILAAYLPYIQDIAFQTMVCRLVYPNVHVSSWLMMPDRAKVMKSIPSSERRTNNQMDEDIIPTVEETIQSIDDSIASLLNVDELVEKALSTDVSYPDSKKGETLQTVAYHWAEKINNNNFGLESFPPTIGAHCSSCEYRIKDLDEKTFSGFDICWQEATGMSIDEVQSTPLIVDLYGNTQKSLKQFLSEDKYTLSALSDRDFDLENDTVQVDSGANKKSVSGHSITRNQRQLYQVETIKRRSTENDTNVHPSYIIKRNRLKQIMGTFKYPLHFIDFETLSPAIPYYSNMSPYEIFGFQFSHHTLTNDNGVCKVQHASEFLHTEIDTCKSPNVAFLKALHNSIGKADNDGTIFQWSPHETIVLKSMLKSPEAKELSSEEMESLTNILDTGIVDLFKLAHKYYYVDGSEGSSSIKRLLRPTINASGNLKAIYGSPTYNSNNFKNFQWYQIDDNGAIDPYDILSGMNQSDGEATDAITKGGAAAAAYHTLQNNLDLSKEDRKSIEKSLLRYCELDTLAMVMIYQAWEGFINNDDDS